MSDISGPGGNFVGSGISGHFSGWNGILNPTIVENTGFAENGNRTYLATAQNITGAAVGTAVTGGNLPSGITGSTPSMSTYSTTITLTGGSGSTASFPALMSAIALNRPNDGKMDIAVSFISSGAITGTL